MISLLDSEAELDMFREMVQDDSEFYGFWSTKTIIATFKARYTQLGIDYSGGDNGQ